MKKFLADCRGNVALSFGLLAIPLTLSVGAAVDVANANYTRTILQAAADAAALAGATDDDLTPRELKAMVENYAIANGAKDVVSKLKNVSYKRNRAEGSFKVMIDASVDTSLMALAGIKKLDVSTYASVTIGSRALDLALVIDVTGSMERVLPSGGTRMQALKSSAGKLIDILEAEKSSYAILNIGVVPYAEYVNIGTAPVSVLGNKSGWLGCVGSRNSPADVQESAPGAFPVATGVNCPQAAVLPLTTDLLRVKSHINSFRGGGNTYSPTGVFWGHNLLTKETPFPEGMSKIELQRYRGQKILVLMTDGENTISASYPLHQNTDRAKADATTELACKDAKDAGIQVYTISFMVSAAGAQDMLNRCATTPAMAFDADNAAQLDAAFKAIGQKLAEVSLAE